MKPQKRPRKTATFKQKLFSKEYVITKGNGAEAARRVYDGDPENAKIIAYQNLQKPVVQAEISRALDKAGLSVEDLNSYGAEIIKKSIGVKPTQKDAVSMIQFAYKLHNVLPANKSVVGHVTVHDQMVPLDPEELKKKLQEINTRSARMLQEMG